MSYHEQRKDERMKDPEFRAAYYEGEAELLREQLVAAKKVVAAAREAFDPPRYSEANYERSCDLIAEALKEYDR